MTEKLFRLEVVISNKLGLHARPAAEFVRCAQSFDAEIHLCKGEERFQARSILEVLTANLNQGSKVVLEAEGPQAEQAVTRLEALLEEIREREDEEG